MPSAEWARAAAVARRQGGVVSVDQMLAEGISPSAIKRRAAAGDLVRVHRGVYIWPGSPWTTTSAEHAALLRLGPDAALSHLSAGSRQGLCEQPDAVWITVPSSTRAGSDVKGVRVFRTAHFEVTRRRDGIALTPLPRTLVDLAQCVDERELGAVYLQVMQRRTCAPDDVRAVLDFVGARYPGAVLAREVTQEFLPEMESILGAEGFALLKPHIPNLVMGHEVETKGGRTFTCDLADIELRIDFECDSWAFHSTRAQRRANGQRDRAMFAAGFHTERLLTDDIRRTPATTVREMLEVVERRRRDLAA